MPASNLLEANPAVLGQHCSWASSRLCTRCNGMAMVQVVAMRAAQCLTWSDTFSFRAQQAAATTVSLRQRASPTVYTLYFTCASIITGKSCIQRAPLTGVARLLQNSSSTIETGPRRQRECLDLDELAHAELASMEVLWERLIVASQRSGHGLVLGRGNS